MRSNFTTGVLLSGGLLALSACTPSPTSGELFFANLQTLCDETHTGQVVSNQAVDEGWRASVLVVGPVACEPNEIRMPLAVGADRSRTWVLTLEDGQLEFRHQHVESDGVPSAVTEYGGFAAPDGTATRQDFPADGRTKEIFIANDIPDSVPNVWTLRFEDGVLGYALTRPATDTAETRDFRAEFDVTG